MLILIFLLIFCDLHEVSNKEIKIKGFYVLTIAKCYMDAFYQKSPLIPSNDVISFNEAIIPHLAFSDKINDCMKEIKGIKTLKENLFTELKEWRENTQEKLEEEYNAKILKYAPFPTDSSLRQWFNNGLDEDLKPNLKFWQNDQPDILVEKFVKEYDEHFKSFREKLLRKIRGRITRQMKTMYSNIIAEQNEEKQLLLIKRLYVKSYVGAYNSWCDLEKEGAMEKFKDLYLIDMDNMFNRWRRQLSPFSLSLKSGYLIIAEDLIRKLLNLIILNDDDLNRTLKGMLNRITTEIHANYKIVTDSFFKRFFNVEDFFTGIYANLTNQLENVTVNRSLGDNYQTYIPQFPPVKRVIWFVRHAERFDNELSKDDKAEAKNRGYFYFNYCTEQCYADCDNASCHRQLKIDNSPLSGLGEENAAKLNKVFDNINIKHLFASPYERAVQTALKLLGDSHKNYDSYGNPHDFLNIKPEPVFMESMIDCINNKNNEIGFDIDDLKNYHGEERIDWTYGSYYNKNNLEDFMKEEVVKTDISCSRRAGVALNYLLGNLEQNSVPNKFSNVILQEQIDNRTYQNDWLQPGEERAEQIVVVTHGLFLNALQNQIAGMFTCTPLTGIVKIVELYPNSGDGASSSHHAASSSSSTGNNYLENLRLVYFGATKHLEEELTDTNVEQ